MADANFSDAFDSLEKQGIQPLAVAPVAVPSFSDAFDSLRQSTVIAPTIAPETAQEALELSGKSGDPSSAIQNNIETYRKRKQELDVSDFMELNPAMGAWFDEDPLHKSLAQDDYRALSVIEGAFKSIKGGAKAAQLQSEQSALVFRELAGSRFAEGSPEALRISAISQELTGLLPDNETRIQAGARLFGNTSAQLLQAGKKGLEGFLAGSLVGAGIGTVALPGVGTAAGATAGGTAGATAALFNFTFQQEAANSFLEFRNLRDLDGNLIDETTAKTAAIGVGIINGVIETGSNLVQLRLIPGASKIIGLGSKGITKLVKDGLRNTTTRRALTTALTKITQGSATEGFEEFFQALTTAGGRETAQAISGKKFAPDSFSKDLQGAIQQARDAAIGTALTFGALNAASFPSTMNNIRQAKKTQDLVTALGKGAEASKLRERMPEKFKEAVTRIGDGEGVESFFIPKDKWDAYWTEKGSDPRSEAEVVFGDADVYDSVQEGGRIEIPLADYANVIAPTEHNDFFAGNSATTVDGMTSAEADIALKNIPEPTTEEVAVVTPEEAQQETILVNNIAEGATIDEVVIDKKKKVVTSKTGKKETIDTKPVTVTEAQVKKQIRLSTGLTQAVALVREDVALNAAFKKAEQASRVAFREGNKEGVAKEKARMSEIINSARLRLQQTSTTNKLKNQIVKELKGTKAKKQAGKPVGKFTADVQRQLDILRNAFSLSPEQAHDKITENLSGLKNNELPQVSVAIENRVLDMVARLGARTEAGGSIALRNKFSAQELTNLLDEIKTLKEEGRTLTALRAGNKIAQQDELKILTIDTTTGGTGIPESVKTTGVKKPETSTDKIINAGGKLMNIHYGWDTILDKLSVKDKESKPFQSDLSKALNVHDQENAEKAGHSLQMDKVIAFAEDAFGIKGRALTHKLNQDNKQVSLGDFVNANNVLIKDFKMSISEARKLMMEFKDPTLTRTITDRDGMAFTNDMLAAVNSILNDQDTAFIDAQLKFYSEYYDRVNIIYREFYGVDLPFNEFYSPIRRDGFAEHTTGLFTDFLEDVADRRGSVASRSFKDRVENITPLKRQGDVSVIQRHIVEMEHFIAWADKIQELNAVFGDKKVQQAIALNQDTNMNNIVKEFLERFTRGGVDIGNTIKALDFVRTNMTRSVLAIKPTIMFKQLISIAAGAENMPTAHFATGVADFWTHPIETFKFFKENSIWFKERSQFQERDIRAAMNKQEFDAFGRHKGWLDMLMLNVRVGDQAAIIISGWARYRWQTQVNGMSKSDAIRDFETNAERVQQSADLSQLSHIQTRGSLAKLFTQFLSSPIQYVNREASAIRNFRAGRQSLAQTAKTVAIYQVVIPLIYQFIADGFQWDKENDLKAILVGPLNGLFLVGQLMVGLASVVAGAELRDANIPLLSSLSIWLKPLQTALEDVKRGDMSIEDAQLAIEVLSDAGGVATGLPLSTISDTLSGVASGIENDLYVDVWLSALGFSPRAIEKRKEEQ